MLKGCENDTNPNGFFNEYLKEDLMKHKKVFEALGSKMSVESSQNQLSGLGFSSTKRNELIVKITSNFSRVLKIKF
jgi:phenylalanyl-tRNA synthetase beta subunit